ncbi:MAG: hypothetical protein JWO44_614 [Bacteroidetes bacterium]|nr:hypothetical protein [Bacteroidota bacterium]
MKILAFLILLFPAIGAAAQKPASKDTLNGAGSINIYYGTKFIKPQPIVTVYTSLLFLRILFT